jgi:hypothetical protein
MDGWIALLLLVSCLKNAGKYRKAFSVAPAQPESWFIAGEPKMKMDAGFRRHDDIRILRTSGPRHVS